MLGLGGCPMTSKELIGNLSTENLIQFFKTKNVNIPIDLKKYNEALIKANMVFNTHL